jgi:hypothetical protein
MSPSYINNNNNKIISSFQTISIKQNFLSNLKMCTKPKHNTLFSKTFGCIHIWITYCTKFLSLFHLIYNIIFVCFYKFKFYYWQHRQIIYYFFIRRYSMSFNSSKCLSILYWRLVHSVLESIVWTLFTIGDSLRIDKAQNSFLNYPRYRLNIFHPPHDYQTINDVFWLDSFERQILSYRFISGLLYIDASRLLERLSVQVLSNTRSQKTFYIPTSRSNFAANALLLRMMLIYNSNALWKIYT